MNMLFPPQNVQAVVTSLLLEHAFSRTHVPHIRHLHARHVQLRMELVEALSFSSATSLPTRHNHVCSFVRLITEWLTKNEHPCLGRSHLQPLTTTLQVRTLSIILEVDVGVVHEVSRLRATSSHKPAEPASSYPCRFQSRVEFNFGDYCAILTLLSARAVEDDVGGV